MSCDQIIKPAVRAVIRKDALVLVQIKLSATGRRYLTLPGGRQDHGETAIDCLNRECREEIGIAPDIGPLLHVADVLRHRRDGLRQTCELLFSCRVPDDYIPHAGHHPDKRQVGVIWANPVTDGAMFMPRYDLALTGDDAAVYLGALRCETA